MDEEVAEKLKISSVLLKSQLNIHAPNGDPRGKKYNTKQNCIASHAHRASTQ